MSSKKITYSSDFKLKVLDYYFKHGGDEKFGLKKKTAGHFNIDKKTINRMLNNPDMVKRARKLLAARKASGSAKTASSGPRQPAKPVVKKAGGTTNKSSTTATKSASSSQASASSSSSSNKASTSITSSTKTVGSNSRQQVNSTSSNSNKTTPTKSKPGGLEDKGSPGVEVYELPEDPDYSLLKQSINAASNGVASLAKLLVTGTEEVRSVVLNECDVILECKVCRNLFRSVVNFLAHKRIYCQEEFADVRTLFHKGDVQGITSQTNTIVVEPEPPPENENFIPLRTTIPTTHISPMKPIAQGRSRRSGIDSIALKLARKRKAYHASSSTHVGSSSYYQSLSEVSRSRDKLSRDCSVVLEDIGVANAVFQTYVPPGAASPSTSMSCMVEEAANSKSGITVAINQNGDIVKTAAGDITSMDVDQPSSSSESRDLTCLLCNTSFATQKALSVHQRSHHGYERCIYYCPICQASFLSMWAVVKHLQRTHKKTKNQIDRLRKVVRKNVRKKMTYQNTEKDKTNAEPSKEVEESVEEEEEEEEEDSNHSSTKTSELVSPKKKSEVVVKNEVSIPVQTSPVKTSTHKGDESSLRRSPDHRCVKCDRKFSTPCALVSHDKFCSLRQMMPPESSLTSRLRSETPEKKIAIQIRKDYKKPVTPFDVCASNLNENKITQVMFKIPKTPQEKENQSKIEAMMGEFCNLPSLACIPCGRRYQAIAALKRHASLHIDWTRFECKVCQYRSYHRYETINHCISEHKVKESAAGNMLNENEYVGGLRYFLDNEDSTPATSDTEQDHQEEEETCSHTISLLSDRGREASTSHRNLEDTPSEMEVDGTGHLEAYKSTSDDNSDSIVLPEKHGTKEEDVNTPENIRSKEYESPPEKAKDLPLLDADANNVCLTGTTTVKPEPVTALDKTSDSKSLVNEVQKPAHIIKGVYVDTSLHEDDCSKVSCEEKMECLCEKEDNISSCKEEFNRSYKDIPESKDHVVDKGILYFKGSEATKEDDVKKNSNSTVRVPVLEFDVCSLSNKDAKRNADASEHVDKPNNCHTVEDCVIDQHSEKVKDEDAEKVKEIVEEEDREKVNDEETEETKDKVEDGTEEIKDKAEDKTKEIRDKVEDRIEEIKDKVEPETVEIKGKVEPETEEIEDKVEDCDTEKIADNDDKKTENRKHNFEDKDTEKIKDNDEDTENSKDNDDDDTENTKDNDEDTENTQDTYDEDTENTQDKFEVEDIEEIKDKYDKDIEEVDIFKDSSSNDDTEDTAITKTDDTESSSSCIEISERDSMTECSEQTTTSQSATVNDAAEDEMSISESESDVFCGDIEEIKSISNKGKEKLVVKDESVNLMHKMEDIDLYDYKDPSIAVHRCEEMKRDANFGMLQTERDVKPIIPKDDLSLEVKDFVGFPSEKDDKFDRPHRMRRSIEQLDFIYDSTKTVSVKTESEDDGSSVPQIELQVSKEEGGRCNLRRRSSLGKSEVVAKKVKNEEEYKPESCNGSSFQSTTDKKNENHTLSPKKSIDGQLSKTSEHPGSSSGVERRKVRLVRRRMDITPGGSFSLTKDGNKSKVNDSGKGKNLEKTVSESNCTNSKTLITKESPTTTRYSSRLKLASGPTISKKENKQHDILSARILTNGQGQSNLVVTAEKVKL